MRLLRLLSLVAVIFAFPLMSLTQQASLKDKASLKDVTDSVVQIAIMAQDGKNTNPMGTGFFVGPDTILSDGHVFWEAGRTANEKRIPGWYAQRSSQGADKHFLIPLDIVKLDDVHDLVLFKFNPTLLQSQWPEFTVKPLKIAQSEDKLEVGMAVALFGFYQGYTFPLVLKGSIAGDTSTPTQMLGGIDEFLLALDTNYGFSGGPVILADTGEVIGVMEGFLPNTPPAQGFANGLSRAVRLKYVKAFMPSPTPGPAGH